MTMRTTILGLVLLSAVSSVVYAADNKRGHIGIPPGKNEGTINLSKDGTWKAGASDLSKSPSPSEAQRRREESQTAGQVFVRKTFR